ncbi:MAG: hypothetical protein H0U74_18300 [Bradymonadaceae bacterium]|nr:hypothetical protein [Lujinxingiaceae bacterium]
MSLISQVLPLIQSKVSGNASHQHCKEVLNDLGIPASDREGAKTLLAAAYLVAEPNEDSFIYHGGVDFTDFRALILAIRAEVQTMPRAKRKALSGLVRSRIYAEQHPIGGLDLEEFVRDPAASLNTPTHPLRGNVEEFEKIIAVFAQDFDDLPNSFLNSDKKTTMKRRVIDSRLEKLFREAARKDLTRKVFNSIISIIGQWQNESGGTDSVRKRKPFLDSEALPNSHVHFFGEDPYLSSDVEKALTDADAELKRSGH